MKIKKFNENDFEENAYIVENKKDAYVIDPGFNVEEITDYLMKNDLSLKMILLTHCHIDHTGDMDILSKTFGNAPIYVPKEDLPMLFDNRLNCSLDFSIPKAYDKKLNIITYGDKDEVDDFKFIHTPGHTKGSSLIEYAAEKGVVVFSGDTLFKGTVGRTDLYGGSMGEMRKSLELIESAMPMKAVLYPGHFEKTTLKEEMESNPFLSKRK